MGPQVKGPEETPFSWLDQYFRGRAELAARESRFKCLPACQSPGCKSPVVQIPVSLAELAAAARFLGLSPSEAFDRYYFVGPFIDRRQDWLRRLALRLHKPCPFLAANRCQIYPLRPLACILFPEHLVLTGEWESWAARPEFQDFLCLREPPALSPARVRFLQKLSLAYEKDLALTEFYLFGASPCYVDGASLLSGLSQGADNPGGANELLDSFFRRQPEKFPFFPGFREKLAALGQPSGMLALREWFRNESLWRQLRQKSGGREVVYRLRKGRVVATRRGIPAATTPHF